MAPRTILYTGKGGVGKTSVATATARAAPRRARARSCSPPTPPTRSPSRSRPPSAARPTDVGDGLFAQQIQAQDELERHWSAVQRWLGGVLVERGVDRIAAEELTVPPGGDELFSLLALKAHHESGDWDVIVVDCAPTGETLRLLSFPDAARWWLDKVLRARARAAGRRAAARAHVPGPPAARRARVRRDPAARGEPRRDARAAARRRARLDPARDDARPDGRREAMRTFTYLNLYGYLTDAVVVNRVFPDEVDGYFGAWRAVQAGAARARRVRLRARARAARAVLRARGARREMLDRLGEALFAGRDAGAVLHGRVTQELSLHDGGRELRLDLPFAEQGRRLAEEDRARAGRPRRRPQAHDPAAGRDGGLPTAAPRWRTGRWSSGSPSRRPVRA